MPIHWAQRIKNCNNTTTTRSTHRAPSLTYARPPYNFSHSAYTPKETRKSHARSQLPCLRSRTAICMQHHLLPGTRATTTNNFFQVAHVARAAKHKADVCRQGMRSIAILHQSKQSSNDLTIHQPTGLRTDRRRNQHLPRRVPLTIRRRHRRSSPRQNGLHCPSFRSNAQALHSHHQARRGAARTRDRSHPRRIQPRPQCRH